MKILDFVSKKEKIHEMKIDLVEKDFSYHPFFNFIITKLTKGDGDKTFNYGISVFSVQAHEKDLEEAWSEIHKEYKKYFNN